jgi:hypothetical protein
MQTDELKRAFGGELIHPDLRELWNLRELYWRLGKDLRELLDCRWRHEKFLAVLAFSSYLYERGNALTRDIELCHSSWQIAAMYEEWQQAH